jgi:hypothetical protein
LSNGEKVVVKRLYAPLYSRCLQTIKDTEHQIQKLKSKSKRSEEVSLIISLMGLSLRISTVIDYRQHRRKPKLSDLHGASPQTFRVRPTRLSSLITILTPQLTFSLSPCGHVLCQSCLQGWFRKAPPNDEDMYDDGDPDYLMYRLKSCPCCRANVRDRPVPVFIVKSIAVALTKSKEAKAGSSVARASPLPAEGDPWAGLFPPVGEDEFGEDDDEDGNEDDEDDEDEDEEEDDEDEDDYNEWLTEVFAYGSASEEEPFEGDYVSPQWEPPSVDIDPTNFEFEDLDDDDLNVLRRGATIDMLDIYRMTYSHEEGLVARVDNEQLYLGWNILLSADDDAGEEYIDYLFKDMLDRPERWDITEGDDGGRVCHRLVPEDEVLSYETTDSEVEIDYGG